MLLETMFSVCVDSPLFVSIELLTRYLKYYIVSCYYFNIFFSSFLFHLGTQFHPEFTGTIVANELIPHIKNLYPSFEVPPPTASVPSYLYSSSSSLSELEARFSPSAFTHDLLVAIVQSFLSQ